MQYTISIAWTRDVPPDDLGTATQSEIHRDIMAHTVTTAELMRAKYPDDAFQVFVDDMIVATGQREIVPKR
jgi:hypothetical protein